MQARRGIGEPVAGVADALLERGHEAADVGLEVVDLHGFPRRDLVAGTRGDDRTDVGGGRSHQARPLGVVQGGGALGRDRRRVEHPALHGERVVARRAPAPGRRDRLADHLAVGVGGRWWGQRARRGRGGARGRRRRGGGRGRGGRDRHVAPDRDVDGRTAQPTGQQPAGRGGGGDEQQRDDQVGPPPAGRRRRPFERDSRGRRGAGRRSVGGRRAPPGGARPAGRRRARCTSRTAPRGPWPDRARTRRPRGRQFAPDGRDARDRLLQVGGQAGRVVGSFAERRPAGQHVVGRAGERVDVGPLVDGPTGDLLGRGVVGGAEELARAVDRTRRRSVSPSW